MTLRILSLFLFSTPLGAEEPQVTVEIVGCAQIDGSVVGRLVFLEVVDRARGRIVVALTCQEGALGVAVTSASTGRSVVRRLDAPAADDPDRDRVVALAASQLYLASADELETPLAPAEAPPPRPTFPRKRARGTATVALRAGVRVRGLSDPMALPGVALRTGIHLSQRWMPFLEVGGERGDTHRTGGRVAASSASAAIGAGTRVVRFPAGGLDASAAVGLAYLRLEGAPAFRHRGGITDGVRMELQAGIAPTLELSPLVLAIALVVGLTIPELAGVVPGDSPVSMGGLWFAAALQLGIRFDGG